MAAGSSIVSSFSNYTNPSLSLLFFRRLFWRLIFPYCLLFVTDDFISLLYLAYNPLLSIICYNYFVLIWSQPFFSIFNLCPQVILRLLTMSICLYLRRYRTEYIRFFGALSIHLWNDFMRFVSPRGYAPCTQNQSLFSFTLSILNGFFRILHKIKWFWRC